MAKLINFSGPDGMQGNVVMQLNHCSLLPHRCSVLSDFSHLFLVLNSSVNIIIYGWKDAKFRSVLFARLHLLR